MELASENSMDLPRTSSGQLEHLDKLSFVDKSINPDSEVKWTDQYLKTVEAINPQIGTIFTGRRVKIVIYVIITK